LPSCQRSERGYQSKKMGLKKNWHFPERASRGTTRTPVTAGREGPWPPKTKRSRRRWRVSARGRTGAGIVPTGLLAEKFGSFAIHQGDGGEGGGPKKVRRLRRSRLSDFRRFPRRYFADGKSNTGTLGLRGAEKKTKKKGHASSKIFGRRRSGNVHESVLFARRKAPPADRALKELMDEQRVRSDGSRTDLRRVSKFRREE